MNQRQLECFFAVAKERSFRRAAENLHLGQATVSDAIRALERSLDTTLFVRSTRHVELTPSGHELLAATLGPYEHLDAAFDAVQRSIRRGPGLVVGHTPELGQLLFPHLLARRPDSADEREHPVAWTPRRLHTHEQMAALRSGEIDLGLCWSPQVEHGLTRVDLARTRYVAVLRADDPIATHPSLRLSELVGRRLLVTPRVFNQFLGAILDSALRVAGMSPGDVEEFPHFAEIGFEVASSPSAVGIHPAPIGVLNTTPGLVFRVISDPPVTAVISAVVAAHNPPGVPDLIEGLRRVTAQVCAGLDGADQRGTD